MKKLLFLFCLILAVLTLAGCGNWKTYQGTGFTVNLPAEPSTTTVQTSIPGVGIPTVNSYILKVADPACTIRIFAFDEWPVIFDVPGMAFNLLLPAFLGNQGNRTSMMIATKNGFTAQEYATADKKAIVRFYLNKPATRAVMIESQTNALNPDFVTKVMDSFSPSQKQ